MNTQILKEPSNNRLEQAIQCMLFDSRQKGNTERHMTRKARYLRALSKKVDLFQPTKFIAYIMNAKNRLHPDKPISNGYKKEIFAYYADFCKSNQLPFDKPQIFYEPPIPIIPTTQEVNEIINTCNPNYVCIFTILSETGIEQAELHRTPITRINKEKGILSIVGTKRHNNGVYKLKEHTADMLRIYLSKHIGKEYPFPTPKCMSSAWIKARRRASKRLCKPELENIPLKNLRNYAGARVWLHGYGATFPPKDAIAVMRFMRHKRLEQTLHYIRSINLDEPQEYTSQVVKLGETDTLKRIEELSNSGYEKLTEADGHIIFRKRK